MAFSVSRPAGRRADDVRALRLRFRTLTFTGSYTITIGEVIQAKDVSLKRILGVIPLDPLVRNPANPAPGYFPSFMVAANGTSVALRMIADAAGASGSTIGTERATGAYGTESINVIFVGE